LYIKYVGGKNWIEQNFYPERSRKLSIKDASYQHRRSAVNHKPRLSPRRFLQITLDSGRFHGKLVASNRSTLELAEKMKWKYIGNRTGDATKGEVYIVEIYDAMEKYAKEDMPQFINVIVIQPPTPRNNLLRMKVGDTIKICNPYYEMMKYSHPGFVPVKE
jgi:hypothetical protein